jgi:hypothetical protein
MTRPRQGVLKAAAVLCVAVLLLQPTQSFWPAEDSLWTSELVNSSSLCTDAAVEDLNPEYPPIRQYSRQPQQPQPSFLQHVHEFLGRSLDADGHPQVHLFPLLHNTVHGCNDIETCPSDCIVLLRVSLGSWESQTPS